MTIGGPRLIFDLDALAFIAATGLTDNTQKYAINKLVVDLKANNLWAKMKALYPFVGGTATTHKFNLKDPRDLDIAYRLSFGGGWSHTSNGVQGNAANTFANAHITNADVTNARPHFSIYSRLNIVNPSGFNCMIGHSTNAYSVLMSNNVVLNQFYHGVKVSGLVSYVNTGGFQGFFTNSRAAVGNEYKFYINGSSVQTGTPSLDITDDTQPFYIGAMRRSGADIYHDNRQYAFASIGDALSDTDVSNLHNIITTYQTALSRNI